MNDDASPLRAMNVSLGTLQHTKPEQQESPQPWVMLICSDLGFISTTPQRISAATLYEFFEQYNIIISGTVESGLPSDISPFYIEYPITDLKDFSSSAIAEKLPLLKRLNHASIVCDTILDNKLPASEGLRQLVAMELPQRILRQCSAITLTDFNSGTPTASHAAQSLKVDSILSMMDIDLQVPSSEAQQSKPDLVTALTRDSSQSSLNAAIFQCKESITALTAEIADVVTAQPFFKAAASSWNALKMLLKIIGRNNTLHCYLHSAPFDAAERHFDDALRECCTSSGTPDLVIWDYPVTIDNASMQQLEHIGTLADRHKSAVLTSLYYRDDLYHHIISDEPIRTAIEQPACLPLRRLQAHSAARCLALCAPDARVPRGNGSIEPSLSGAWLFALQWTRSFIESDLPFHLHRDSVSVLDELVFPDFTQETVTDAHRYGLTILKPNTGIFPRVLFGDIDSPFSSLLFNMVVNRTARLAATWLSAHDAALSCDQAAPLLADYLFRQLAPYNILTTSEAIAVTAQTNSGLKIIVDSDMNIATFPVRFEFSFGYRE